MDRDYISPPLSRKASLHYSRPLSQQRRVSGASTVSEASSSLASIASLEMLKNKPNITANEHFTIAIDYKAQDELEKSTYHFKHAALKGHPNGMLNYALCLRNGSGCTQNYRLSFKWMQRAVTSLEEELRQLIDSSYSHMESEQCKKQFAVGIMELGRAYFYGWGTEEDKSAALEAFLAAAKLNHFEAMQQVAYCYENGVGTERDEEMAAMYYRMAI